MYRKFIFAKKNNTNGGSIRYYISHSNSKYKVKYNKILSILKEEKFFKNCDKFRSPHLWTKKNGKWQLRFSVAKDGDNK